MRCSHNASVAKVAMTRMHRLQRWLVLTAVILASAGAGDDAAAGAAGPTGEISYVVRWQPAAGSIPRSEAIGISLTFTAEEARTTIFFPDRWALGLRDLHRRITEISVDGSPYALSLDGPTLDLETRPGQRVTVEYLLSRQRSGAARALPEAVLPAATQDHVFILGWVGLAIPDFFRCTSQPCTRHRVRLRWDVPASWRVASDHGADAREFVVSAIDSPSMLDSLFIAGSTFRVRHLPGGGVLVFLAPTRLSDLLDRIIDDAAHVATTVGTHWPAIPGERAVWLNRLAGRTSRTAGGAIQATSNMALFHSDFGRDHRKVLRSFVHEYLHGWIGLQLFAVDRPRSPAEHFRWFSEGFVDYFTEVFLFRSGLLPPCDMADAYDRTFRSYRDHDDPTVSIGAMAAAGWRRRLRLAYTRGYLIAHELAARLRDSGGETLEQRVLRIVKEGREGALSLPDLMARLTDGDPDAARWLHAALLERRPLERRAAVPEPCRRSRERAGR